MLARFGACRRLGRRCWRIWVDLGGREGLEVGPLDGDANGNIAILHFVDAIGA